MKKSNKTETDMKIFSDTMNQLIREKKIEFGFYDNKLIKRPQRGLIKGDSLSASIAAASVLAKVYRDRIMEEYDLLYPGYGFASHKGYPTKKHLEALKELGVLKIHRKSFTPVGKLLYY